MGKLYIAEKPSVAELLAQTLGGAKKTQTHWTTAGGDSVTWALGHLVSLYDPEDYNPAWRSWNPAQLPMLPEKFKWKPADVGSAQRLKDIAGVINQTQPTSIVNACDAGREGELIFWLIWAELKLEGKVPMERLWLRSMTPEGINKALTDVKPGAEFRNLAVAAASRAMADWVVGMNGTRACSNILSGGKKEVWSVGRVQTPTLAVLVDRAVERETHVPVESWALAGTFTIGGSQFEASAPSTAETAEPTSQTLAGTSGTVQDTITQESRPPFKLFDLTTLQRYMNITAGWTAQRTLDAAQKLYEHEKVITYPRTESDALPADYEKEAQRVLDALPAQGFGKFTSLALPANACPHKELIFDDKAVTDHFAIIPTGIPLNSKVADHQALYATIVKRFIAAFCPAEVVEVKKRTVTMPDGTVFSAQLETTVTPGWKAVYGRSAGSQKGMPLPGESGQPATASKVTPVKSVSQPPPLHNEATLLEAMSKDKSKSLGTAATRASVIENLKRKEYIKPSGGSWEPTPKGMKLVTELRTRGLGELTNADLTGTWEGRLRGIEKGTEKATSFNSDMKQLAAGVVGKLKATPPSIS